MRKLTITDLHQDEALSHSDMGKIAGGRLAGWVGDVAEGIKAAGEKGLAAGGGYDNGSIFAGIAAGAAAVGVLLSIL